MLEDVFLAPCVENDSGSSVDVETGKLTKEGMWLPWWGRWWFTSFLLMTVGMERKGWTWGVFWRP